jgi:RimJ/RimL family protein N-acetyltransferase
MGERRACIMSRFEAFETARLLIRNLAPGDAESFYAYKCLPEATQYQYWRPKSLDEIVCFIRDMQTVEPNTPGTWLQLAICLKDDGIMIGDIGIHFSEDEEFQAEIGYTISPAWQHKGYASEAAKAILEYLFTSLGIHRVHASVDPRNIASAAVLERLGFRQEAHFIQSIFMDGEWQDDCIYAMLDTEWNQK